MKTTAKRKTRKQSKIDKTFVAIERWMALQVNYAESESNIASRKHLNDPDVVDLHRDAVIKVAILEKLTFLQKRFINLDKSRLQELYRQARLLEK